MKLLLRCTGVEVTVAPSFLPKDSAASRLGRRARFIGEVTMPYFDDDGNELNPDLIPKPALCIRCKSDDTQDEDEQILCNLTRLDEVEKDEFICYSFVSKYPSP